MKCNILLKLIMITYNLIELLFTLLLCKNFKILQLNNMDRFIVKVFKIMSDQSFIHPLMTSLKI